MTTQTNFATLSRNGDAPYEVSGLTVTVNGVAVPVLYASPWGIKFYMPTDVPQGVSEIIVSSQDGYVSQGFVMVLKGGSRILTLDDTDNGSAVAANGHKQTTANFQVTTPENFGSDKRTRLTFFATGISGSALNSNPNNDVNLNGVIRPNFAESVSVEAQLSSGQVISLPVEFAGAQGVLPGVDQVNVVLSSSLQSAGNVKLTLVVNGQRSNGPRIFIR
jgi:uncharacterized protein (TIGR03437 family)